MTKITATFHTEVAKKIDSLPASPTMQATSLEETEYGADLSISEHSEVVLQCAVHNEPLHSHHQSPIISTTTSIPDLKATVSSSTYKLQDAATNIEFRSQLTKLCHPNGNIPSATFQLLNGQQNYLADITISDQFMQPVETPEYLISMSATAMKMDEFDSSLSILCHFKGDVPAANLILPLLYSIGPSENPLYNQILMASSPQPPLHPMTVYAVFPSLFGPDWASTPPL